MFDLDCLVSVRLACGLSWPARIIPSEKISIFVNLESNIAIASLLGVNEKIGTDLNTVMYCRDPNQFETFHCQQVEQIPSIHRSDYDRALTELNKIIKDHALSATDTAEVVQAMTVGTSSESLIPVAECTEHKRHPITMKRTDAIIWDDYFMAIAFLSAMRSKDPSTQVGACIVNARNRIVGIGYNGFPRGCSDDVLPWARTAESDLDTKYPYVCHAEMNAILNKNSADLENCKLYVALFPCNECAKIIIQSGITEVVYLSDKYHHTTSMQASRRMLHMAGVNLRQHSPSVDSVCINFSSIDDQLAARKHLSSIAM